MAAPPGIEPGMGSLARRLRHPDRGRNLPEKQITTVYLDRFAFLVHPYSFHILVEYGDSAKFVSDLAHFT